MPPVAAPAPRIYVFGAVSKPGFYSFKPGDRAVDALSHTALAPDANLTKVSVIHFDKARKSATMRSVDVTQFLLRGDMKGNVALTPGDTLFVPQAPKAKNAKPITLSPIAPL